MFRPFEWVNLVSPYNMRPVSYLLPAIITLLGVPPLFGQVASPASTSQDSTAWFLHSGDLVRLRIWREPDLSGEFQVDEAGTVTFPKIGPISVTRESPESLKEKLLMRYAVYLRNPSVEVTMLRRINVLGAVQKPGVYPVDPTMTIADALAAAGGATSMGDQHRIELIRDGVRISKSVDSGLKIGETPLRSGDQLFVPERNFVVRNPGLLAAVVTAFATLFIALSSRK
jgi:protein involved in polysaccharide export with SLBB domain